MSRLSDICVEAFLDGFTSVGILGWLRRPGAPDELIDSGSVEEFLHNEDYLAAITSKDFAAGVTKQRELASQKHEARAKEYYARLSREERNAILAKRLIWSRPDVPVPTPISPEELARVKAELDKQLADTEQLLHETLREFVKMKVLCDDLGLQSNVAELEHRLAELRQKRERGILHPKHT